MIHFWYVIALSYSCDGRKVDLTRFSPFRCADKRFKNYFHWYVKLPHPCVSKNLHSSHFHLSIYSQSVCNSRCSIGYHCLVMSFIWLASVFIKTSFTHCLRAISGSSCDNSLAWYLSQYDSLVSGLYESASKAKEPKQVGVVDSLYSWRIGQRWLPDFVFRVSIRCHFHGSNSYRNNHRFCLYDSTEESEI